MHSSKWYIGTMLFTTVLLGNSAISAYDYNTGVSPPIPDVPSSYGTNAPTAPAFPVERIERNAICLAEATLNTLSAYISANGCANAAGTYYLNINVNRDNKGLATLSGAAVNQITWFTLKSVLIDPTVHNGIKCKVTKPKADLAIIRNVPIKDYQGLYSWNHSGTILIGDVNFIGIDKVWYEERITKNFYALNTDPATGAPAYIPTSMDGAPLAATPANADWGMETVSRHMFTGETQAQIGYPRSTWWQRSLYWPGDNIPGGLQLVKNRLYPSACRVELNVWGYDANDGFDENGTVTVTAGS